MSSADYGIRPGRPETGGETRILDELNALAATRASGALRIDGDPGGVVYLDGGRLVFAEAAGVPDLGARLVGSRWLSPEEWQALRRVERAPGGLGELLVERGLVGRDDMLAVLRSAALDAVTALTVPVAGRPSVTGLWFASRERSWAGSMLALELETVRMEMTRRARLMAGVDVPLDALPVGADMRRPYGVLSRDQWLVACRVDGVTPVRDLVWRDGFALYDTIESVGGLIREGLFALLAPDRAGRGEQGPGVAAGERTTLPDQAETGEDPPWAAAPILAAPTPLPGPATTGGAPGTDISLPRRHGMGNERVRDAVPGEVAGYAEGSENVGGIRHSENARYVEGVGHSENARYVEGVGHPGDARYVEGVGHPGDARYADGAGHPESARQADALRPTPPPPPMPRRRPGASLWDRVHADMRTVGFAQGLPQAARTAFTAATPDLLRRLLHGLKELDEDEPPPR